MGLRAFARRLFSRLDGSLRARLIIPSAILATLTIAGMVAAAVEVHTIAMERAHRERIQLFSTVAAEAIGNQMMEGGARDLGLLFEDLRDHRPELRSMSVLDPEGVVASTSATELVGERPWPPETLGAEPVMIQLGTTTAIVRPMMNEPRCAECHGLTSQVNGYVDLRFDNGEIAQAQGQLTTILIATALPALLVLLGVLWRLIGREAVKPIQGLVTSMRRAEAGDVTVTADNGRPDEFGAAARGFDDMLAALRASQATLERLHEERMIKADRFAMIGQMATGLAHEIKNPLAGLSGALEVLAEEMEDSPHRTEMIHEMQHQVTRLESIMGGLLNFARPPRAHLRSTDVNGCLEKVLFLASQQRRYLKVKLARELGTLPSVRADAGQLEQVFLNVCLNAYQAMGEAGGTLTVRSLVRADRVVVEIADTGPGIPPEVRASIFTPFFTTRSNGTGLGLATSVRLLAQHGGLMEFDCPQGGGTVFTISLPVEVPAPRASPGLAVG